MRLILSSCDFRNDMSKQTIIDDLNKPIEQCKPAFASGRVDGYFDGEVPDEFWMYLAFYICVGQLSSLPWAIPYGEKDINTMLENSEKFAAWYDDWVDPVPRWYRKGKYEKSI